MKFIVPILVLIFSACSGLDARADMSNTGTLYNPGLWRFELNNDIIFKSDSNFSNGWSLQYHSRSYASWEDTRAPKAFKWVGQNFPTLSHHGSIVRHAQAIGQNLITPGDITNPNPSPSDLPYSAALNYTFNWQRCSPDSASTFQVTLGVLGENAFGEEIQTFVHNDLGLGDTPRGWSSQRDNEPILNLGYQYLYRLGKFGTYHDDWAGQYTIGSAIHVGNLVTLADLIFTFRFGWNMAEGFSAYPAPPGRGIFTAHQIPKPDTASVHGLEFVLGFRGTALGYTVLYDGSLITDDERDVDRENVFASAGMSINYHHYNLFSIRLTLLMTTDLLDESDLPQPLPGGEKTRNNVSYGTLMFDFFF